MCEFEDSQNCIWIAQLQGNGKGDSFVNFMGHILYAEELVFIAIMVYMVVSSAVIIFDIVTER